MGNNRVKGRALIARAKEYAKKNFDGTLARFGEIPVAGNMGNGALISTLTYLEVPITSEQILNDLADGIEILPAPAPGTYYDIHRAILEFNKGTISYDFNGETHLSVWGGNNGDINFSLLNVLWITRNYVSINSSTNDLVGESPSGTRTNYLTIDDRGYGVLVGTYGGQALTLGDGTLTVKIWYEIITFGAV